MHYVSNVKGEDPVISAIIFNTKSAARRNFKFLFYLQLAHFFKGLEWDLKFLLFSHSILEVISSLFEVPLTDL